MTLKQVVLPAPLGPMRPRISPLLMWKLTSLSATTPPKRRVTASTSSSFSPSATAGTPKSSGAMMTSGLISVTSSTSSCWRGRSGCTASDMVFSFLEDGLSGIGTLGTDRAFRRQQTLRPEDREQHQGEAEDEHAEVREVTEPLREVADDDRADDDAPPVARATDDDGGEEEGRQEQLEALGVDEARLGREERAGKAADGSTERERQQLEAEGGHSHQLCGVLVLSCRLPGAPHPAVLDEDVEEQHEADDDEGEPVVRDEVADPELEERRRRVEVDDRDATAPVKARHLEDHEAGGLRNVGDPLRTAEPLRVDEAQAHDLTETERDDGEVVAAHAQRRGTEDDAREHGRTDRDGHDDDPREVGVLGAQDTHGVGADRVEADVAEVEQ